MKFKNPINSIEIIGQNGKLLDTKYSTNEALYFIKDSDTYIRVEAHDHHFSFYLNPIVRFDGKTIPLNTNLELTVNGFKTWLFRMIMWIFLLIEIYLIYRVIKRKSRFK